MDSKKFRCFVAFSFSEETKCFLETVIKKFKPSLAGVKWVKKGQMHLTLHFFPGLSPAEVKEVSCTVEEVSQRFSPFPIKLEDLGVFPAWNKTRVIWVGLDSSGGKKVEEIFFSLEEGLGKKNFPLEKRRFTPHITLARSRYPLSISPDSWRLPQPFPTELNELVFIQSVLTPQGPLYQSLGSFPLKNFAGQSAG